MGRARGGSLRPTAPLPSLGLEQLGPDVPDKPQPAPWAPSIVNSFALMCDLHMDWCLLVYVYSFTALFCSVLAYSCNICEHIFPGEPQLQRILQPRPKETILMSRFYADEERGSTVVQVRTGLPYSHSLP